jgi:hypothetical protein
MAIQNKINTTITEFREEINSRGFQIASLYEVTMVHGDSIICYPLSIITPGRQFIYYNHDIWGPTRKIPYKRTYTQCNMSFIIHNDWAERIFLETWANDAIKNLSGLNLAAGAQLDSTGNQSTDANVANQVVNAVKLSASSPSPRSIGNYGDYTNYLNGLGTVVIKCLDSKDKSKVNLEFKLTEAYPAILGPITLASDGSGYATFNVTFQFRDYIMINGE